MGNIKKRCLALAIVAALLTPCVVHAETTVNLDRSRRNERLQQGKQRNDAPVINKPITQKPVPVAKPAQKPIIEEPEEDKFPQQKEIAKDVPDEDDEEETTEFDPQAAVIENVNPAKREFSPPVAQSVFSPTVPIKTPVYTPWKAAKLKELAKQVEVEQDKIYDKIYYRPKKREANPICLWPVVIQDNDTNTVSANFRPYYISSWSSTSTNNFSYSGGSLQWINFDTVSVRANNRAFVIHYDYSKGTRDSGTSSSSARILWAYSAGTYRYVTESYFEPMDETAFAAFQAIANTTGEVNVRFSGKDYEVTRKMKPKLIKGIKTVYEIYNLLKS